MATTVGRCALVDMVAAAAVVVIKLPGVNGYLKQVIGDAYVYFIVVSMNSSSRYSRSINAWISWLG